MSVSIQSKDKEDNLLTVLSQVSGILRVRFASFISVSLLGILFVLLFVAFLPPRFTAEAEVRLNPDRISMAAEGAPDSKLTPEAIETEVELLKSEEVALAVTRKLNLLNRPQFARLAKESPSTDLKELVIARFLQKNLVVDRRSISYLLSVSYTSKSPRQSAEIANGFAEAYIANSVRSRSLIASQKVIFLKTQLQMLAADIQKAGGTPAAAVRGDVGESPAPLVDAQKRANREQFDKLAQALLETQRTANNIMSQAEVVSPARISLRPSFPSKLFLLVIGSFFAVLLGAVAVIIKDFLEDSLRSVDDLEQMLDTPVLAVVPHVKKVDFWREIMERPTSLFSEAYRRAGMLVVRQLEGARSIAVTSALPREGKTVTALALAEIIALSGRRTVLVDCDVRKASLKGLMMGEEARHGLVEVLSGLAELDDVLMPTQIPQLHFLSVQAVEVLPNEIYGASMERLIAALRVRYDYVVLDIPSVLGPADGEVLAQMADGVVFVVQWGQTPRRAVAAAMNTLANSRSSVIGAVMTKVSRNAGAIGGAYFPKKHQEL